VWEEGHTYCAIGSLGFIPVMGRKMMKPVEDILVRHACQAGWRVGPGDESRGRGRGRGRGGHCELGGVSEDREGVGVRGVDLYKREVDEVSCGRVGRNEPMIHKKGGRGGKHTSQDQKRL